MNTYQDIETVLFVILVLVGVLSAAGMVFEMAAHWLAKRDKRQ